MSQREHYLEEELFEANAKIAALEREHAKVMAELTAWQEAGEKLLIGGASLGVFFSMGLWWADRPWRKRK